MQRSVCKDGLAIKMKQRGRGNGFPALNGTYHLPTQCPTHQFLIAYRNHMKALAKQTLPACGTKLSTTRPGNDRYLHDYLRHGSWSSGSMQKPSPISTKPYGHQPASTPMVASSTSHSTGNKEPAWILRSYRILGNDSRAAPWPFLCHGSS